MFSCSEVGLWSFYAGFYLRVCKHVIDKLGSKTGILGSAVFLNITNDTLVYTYSNHNMHSQRELSNKLHHRS